MRCKSSVVSFIQIHFKKTVHGLNYSKTCLKLGSLMKVESIAECSPLEHSAILLTCIKR